MTNKQAKTALALWCSFMVLGAFGLGMALERHVWSQEVGRADDGFRMSLTTPFIWLFGGFLQFVWHWRRITVEPVARTIKLPSIQLLIAGMVAVGGGLLLWGWGNAWSLASICPGLGLTAAGIVMDRRGR